MPGWEERCIDGRAGAFFWVESLGGGQTGCLGHGIPPDGMAVQRSAWGAGVRYSGGSLLYLAKTESSTKERIVSLLRNVKRVDVHRGLTWLFPRYHPCREVGSVIWKAPLPHLRFNLPLQQLCIPSSVSLSRPFSCNRLSHTFWVKVSSPNCERARASPGYPQTWPPPRSTHLQV